MREPSNPIGDDMTNDQKIARRKLSLLQLARDLANVSRACKSLPPRRRG
ncbi:MAG: hypothetical protein BroJett030_26840 [Alphaproteobacteria bacterium]|nr:MAG: hypothetical protein BroJett030_26840 [Alphaproteobacteria bacterium]